MSIRKKLVILMLVIGLLPTLIVSVVAYIAISNELTRKTADQLVSTTSKQEQKINSILQTKQEEAIKLTNRFDLQSALEQYEASNGRGGGQTLYNILFAKKVDTPDIQAIYVTDQQGRIAASTVGLSADKQLVPEEYMVESGQESTIRLHEDRRDGINKLYIANNLKVNNKQAGYLIVIFRTDDIVATVQDYTGLGDTGETIVAARGQNNTVVPLFPLRFDTDAALKRDLTSLRLLADPSGSYRTTTDYRDRQVLMATKTIDFADWVVATKIDKSETLAPLAQLRNSLISIFLVSSFAIILVAIYFSRFFTRPIIHIAQIAEWIGKGDLSARVVLRRNDEIGALGNSINAMGASLKEYVSHLQNQRKRLEIILDSTAESILAVNREGVIILANRAVEQLTRQPAVAIVGKRVSEVFAWRHNMQPLQADYAKPGVTSYPDLQYTDTAGATHYVKLVIAQADAQHHADAQTIVTIHDETQSRELENMKIDFVSMAAHELRTPLAAIRGYVELVAYKLRLANNASKDIGKYLDQSLKSTTELGGLITNLLDVTRIERGTLVLNFEKIDLAADLQQAIHNAGFNAHEKNIQLVYTGPTENCFVAADEIALHEVINNLLTNAVKYTNSGGKIEVSLRVRGDSYAVSVADTGIGIPKNALPNLFTKFYRVRGGLNSGSNGTGLGLFIAKSIIERHSGTIAVDSKEGIGSTFVFTIPKLTPERLAAHQGSLHQNVNSTRRKRGWITQNITR